MILHEIPGSAPMMPLEKYLKRAWPLLPPGALRELLSHRDVKRDGRRLGAADLVRGGQTLAIYLPDRAMPGPAKVLFDDGALLALLKPQGLPVDVDRDGIGADTLLSRVRETHPNAQLCHRLDAETGGLVLAATNADTRARMEEVFREHQLTKGYVALVRGGFEAGEGTLTGWLVKDAQAARVRIVRSKQPGARRVETRWRLLSEQGGVSQVALTPVTGRTHQLRAQMADFGHPILGDDAYGDRAFNRIARGPLRLWCATIRLAPGCAAKAYAGRLFKAPSPAWWKARE